MALATADGDDIISLRLWLPRVGVGTADVLFDDITPRSGRVVIQVGDREFRGAIDRGGEFEDTDRTRVVLGAGGMGKAAEKRQYSGVSLQLVVSSLLATAGETLSPSSDQDVLQTVLPAWTTSAEPIGTILSALVESVGGGAVWRVLPDGTVWIGRETWPDAGIEDDSYQVMEQRFEDGSWLATVNEEAAGALRPGTTFNGQRVSLVVHTIDGDEGGLGPRMRVWFSDAGEASMEDRLAGAFERAVRSAGPPPVDYRAMYLARVVAQIGTRVHVEPELTSMPDMGAIPLMLGLPGATTDGLAGGNVLVGWRGGDRAKAYAVCFDADVSVASLKLAPAALHLGGGALPQPVPLGTGLVTYLASLAAAINSLGGSAAPPEPTTLLSGSVTVTS